MEFKYESQNVQMAGMLRPDEWIPTRRPVLNRAFQSILDVAESVGWDEYNRPCLKETKFPIRQIFAELSDGMSVKEIAHDFSLNEQDIRIFLQEMAGMCQ